MTEVKSLGLGLALFAGSILAGPVVAASGSDEERASLASTFLDQAEAARFQRSRAYAIRGAIEVMDSEHSAPLVRAFELLEKEMLEHPRVSRAMHGYLDALAAMPNVMVYGPNMNLIREKARVALKLFGLPDAAFDKPEDDPDEYQGGIIPATTDGIRLGAIEVVLHNGYHTVLNVDFVRDFFEGQIGYQEDPGTIHGPSLLRRMVEGAFHTLDSFTTRSESARASAVHARLVEWLQKRLQVESRSVTQFEAVTDLIEGLTIFAAEHKDPEAILPILEAIIQARGALPCASWPGARTQLYQLAFQSKERLVTDWGQTSTPAPDALDTGASRKGSQAEGTGGKNVTEVTEVAAPASDDFLAADQFPHNKGVQVTYREEGSSATYRRMLARRDFHHHGIRLEFLRERASGRHDGEGYLIGGNIGVRLDTVRIGDEDVSLDAGVQVLAVRPAAGDVFTTTPEAVHPVTGHRMVFECRTTGTETLTLKDGHTVKCVKVDLVIRDEADGSILADLHVWFGHKMGLVKRQGSLFGVRIDEIATGAPQLPPR